MQNLTGFENPTGRTECPDCHVQVSREEVLQHAGMSERFTRCGGTAVDHWVLAPVLVWAFEPRKGSAFFVLEQQDDLHTRAGDLIAAEQCDRCGADLYVIDQDSVTGAWYAYCADYTHFEDSGAKRRGCGARYPIRLRDEDEVIF